MTRNTQTLHPDDFPARRLHRYILDKYVSPKDMEDSALVRHELYPDNEESNSLVDLIHMKFPTVYRNIRRLNRTVTFIPFHLGSWRKPGWWCSCNGLAWRGVYELPKASLGLGALVFVCNFGIVNLCKS